MSTNPNPRTQNALTHQQYFEVVKYMLARAVDGSIDVKVQAFCDEVEKVTSIKVCYGTMLKAAEDNDIKLIYKAKAKIKSISDQLDEAGVPRVSDQLVQEALDKLNARLSSIQTYNSEKLNKLDLKLSAIIVEFGIKWGQP